MVKGLLILPLVLSVALTSSPFNLLCCLSCYRGIDSEGRKKSESRLIGGFSVSYSYIFLAASVTGLSFCYHLLSFKLILGSNQISVSSNQITVSIHQIVSISLQIMVSVQQIVARFFQFSVFLL